MKKLLSKAEKLRQSGDYEKAADLYKRYLAASFGSNLKHRKKSNKCSGRTNVRGEQMFCDFSGVEALIGLADCLRIFGEFEESRKKYFSAAELLRKSDIVATAADTNTYLLDCLIGEALCDKGAGKYKLALSKLEKIKKIAVKQKDAAAIGFILWHIGMTYRFLGELGKSKKYLNASLWTHRKIKDLNGVGFSLCGLGGCLRASGDIKNSLKHYSAANKIFSKTKDAYGLAYSYCGMANAYKALGKIKEAILFYGNSEPLYMKSKDLSSLAFVYKGLAGCYLNTGCEVLSDFYFGKSAALFRESNDARGLLSLYLEKLSKKYCDTLYEKAFSLAVKNNLKKELEYLKKYSRSSPSKWLG